MIFYLTAVLRKYPLTKVALACFSILSLFGIKRFALYSGWVDLGTVLLFHLCVLLLISTPYTYFDLVTCCVICCWFLSMALCSCFATSVLGC